MAEQQGGGEAQTEVIKTQERQIREGTRAVNARLGAELKKMNDGTGVDKTSKEGQVLTDFHNLSNLDKNVTYPIPFDKATGEAHDIKPADQLTTTVSGAEYTLPENIRLSQIAGVTDEGDVQCFFVDEDENPVMDPNNKNPLKVTVAKDDLLLWQVQSEKDSYQTFFQGDTEPLLDAYTGKRQFGQDLEPVIDKIGQETGMPIRDAEFVEADSETPLSPELTAANNAIVEQLAYLKHRLESGELNDKQKDKAELVLAQLQIGQAMNGDLLSSHYKAAVLSSAQNLWMDLPNGDLMKDAAGAAVKKLNESPEGSTEPSVIKNEQATLKKAMEDAKVSDEKQAEIMKLAENAKNPADMAALLTSVSSLNLPNLSEGLFGKGITDSKAQILLDGIMTNSGFTEEQKGNFGELAKRIGFWAAMAALIVGGGAILLTGAAAFGTASLASSLKNAA